MERIHYLANHRLYIKLAAAFIGLNILDAFITKILSAAGGYELNPILRHILGLNNDWMFLTAKIGTAITFTLILLMLAPRFPRAIKNIFTLLVFAMAVICVWNLIASAWL